MDYFFPPFRATPGRVLFRTYIYIYIDTYIYIYFHLAAKFRLKNKEFYYVPRSLEEFIFSYRVINSIYWKVPEDEYVQRVITTRRSYHFHHKAINRVLLLLLLSLLLLLFPPYHVCLMNIFYTMGALLLTGRSGDFSFWIRVSVISPTRACSSALSRRVYIARQREQSCNVTPLIYLFIFF